ncbi:hypothetical protein FEM48_Zijuj03G0001600 [Ziziphus jujuba var. spinosa]|uniref:Uncharacterized protein n=1 Tax=Ziziphus jujuba var. spinosa TaxID=714518 RepID=A0A978VM21_ZIZJJ|nr:hypothetical protein FEM48_Zijuj03G0001600 [Ziziphus jujuba var. spinosa]
MYCREIVNNIIIVLDRLSAIIRKHENNTQARITRPNRTGNDAGRMQVLDDDGIAALGEIIRDQMIDKLTNSQSYEGGYGTGLTDRDFKFASRTFKGPIGESSVVDKVALFKDKNNNMCIKYLVHHTRRHEGKMIELLVGRAEVSCGRFRYGSAFGEPSGHADTVEAIDRLLWPTMTFKRGPFFFFFLLLFSLLASRYHRLSTTGIYLHGTNLLPEAKAHGEISFFFTITVPFLHVKALIIV